MNIFFLHRSAPICAQYHADKHVVKMILECAQLLSSAHHHFGHQVTYKATHMNHPCAIWTRGSRLQYMFVSDLAKALCREYAIRFGKQHKTSELIHGELLLPPAELTNSKWSDPPLVMPDEFKGKDIIESYQRYYASKNDTMSLRWFSGKRLPPLWFTLNINEMAAA